MFELKYTYKIVQNLKYHSSKNNVFFCIYSNVITLLFKKQTIAIKEVQ